jgi:Tfp pilus assembly protein PilX
MLMNSKSRIVYPRAAGRAGQGGAVLLIALIVLIAMTLSAIALIRSVNLTNLVSGNMAFRESAVLSSERATERAIADWLQPNAGAAGGGALYTHNAAEGYRAVREDPAANQSWDAFWLATLDGQAKKETSPDVAGNYVSYVIHRMCDGTGAPATVNCSKSPISTSGGSYITGGTTILPTASQIYYRITTRVAGPRNAVVYTQTIIAI